MARDGGRATKARNREYIIPVLLALRIVAQVGLVVPWGEHGRRVLGRSHFRKQVASRAEGQGPDVQVVRWESVR